MAKLHRQVSARRRRDALPDTRSQVKVCPNCQSRFDQGESFCPNDGSKLVDAEELSPGELTGRELGGVVRLEELERVDEMGERYRGVLTEADRPVRVTVFNRGSAPHADRLGDVDAILDQLHSPIPPEILAAHSFELDGAESFVVEQTADGQALGDLLEERETLSWKQAIRVTAHLAQALHWMAERGHLHRGLHPGAIYVTDLDEGTVQIGDWLQTALTYEKRPLERAENGADFVGFAPYMPPEVIDEEGQPDERSLVYALGMLLYEMVLGQPPFVSGETEEVLKRHLHEKPLKLAVAAGSEDFHPELDDVLSMMWGKVPDERFQTPKATIAALSSLVDESPRALAPAPASADTPVFEGPPTSESKADGGESSGDGASPDTMLGLGSPASETGDEDDDEVADDEGGESSDAPDSSIETGEAAIDVEDEEEEERDRVSSAEMPSIIIEDPELRSAMEGDEDEEEKKEGETDDHEDDTADRDSEGESADRARDNDDETAGLGFQYTVDATDIPIDNSVESPAGGALVTGFVDGETGLTYSPDSPQGTRPVKPTDLTREDETGAEESAPEDESDGPDDAAAKDREEPAEPESAESDEATAERTDEKEVLDEETADVEETAESTDVETDEEPEPADTDEAGETAPADGAASDEDAEDDLEESEDAPDSESEGETEPGGEETDDAADEDEKPAETEEKTEETESEDETVSDEETEDGDETETVVAEESGESDDEVEAESEVAGDATGDEALEDEDFEAAPDLSQFNTEAEDEDVDVSDEWFEVSEKEAWMAADVREERDRSEVLRKYATYGFAILLVVCTLGLIIFTQTYEPASNDGADEAEQKTTENE